MIKLINLLELGINTKNVTAQEVENYIMNNIWKRDNDDPTVTINKNLWNDWVKLARPYGRSGNNEKYFFITVISTTT